MGGGSAGSCTIRDEISASTQLYLNEGSTRENCDAPAAWTPGAACAVQVLMPLAGSITLRPASNWSAKRLQAVTDGKIWSVTICNGQTWSALTCKATPRVSGDGRGVPTSTTPMRPGCTPMRPGCTPMRIRWYADVAKVGTKVWAPLNLTEIFWPTHRVEKRLNVPRATALVRVAPATERL